jgi:hypothetical protein
MSVLRVKKLPATLIGAFVLSTALSAALSPALALGGCGPNGHRGPYGGCRWGGQNQAWCLHHTGHVATRMPNGELICFR